MTDYLIGHGGLLQGQMAESVEWGVDDGVKSKVETLPAR